MSSLEEKAEHYQEHLAVLTQMSVHHIGVVQSALGILVSHANGETNLTEEERMKFLTIAKNSTDTYLQFVRESIKDRQAFIDKDDKL